MTGAKGELNTVFNAAVVGKPNSIDVYTADINSVRNSTNLNLSINNLDLMSGHLFHVRLTYSGNDVSESAKLALSLTDTVTQATVSQAYDLDLVGILGNNVSLIFNAFADNSGPGTSDITRWVFVSGAPTATPVISPANSSEATSITITDATLGSTIYYTLDGSEPTSASAIYSGPVSIPAGSYTTVKTVAIASGVPSQVATSVYTNNGPRIDLNTGFALGSVVSNGTAVLDGTALRLTTSGIPNQAGSAFSSTPLNVRAFTTDFDFQLTYPFTDNNMGDGMMFVIQSQGPTALGEYGQFLGFGGIPNSIGVKFDLNNSAGGGGNNSTGLFSYGPSPVYLYADGSWPVGPDTDLTPDGIDLHSGHLMHARMTYDGITLAVSIIDMVTQKSATQTYVVNIPTKIGAQIGYVGFTGGTGASSAVQKILNWSFVPGPPVAAPALPAPATVTKALALPITDATNGASIYYTLDGTIPTANSSLYTSPVNLTSTTTLTAVAIRNGITSAVTRATYIITTPTIDFSNGFIPGYMSLNGSATLYNSSNNMYLSLTPCCVSNQAGSAFYFAPVSVNSFSTDFTFQLGNPANQSTMADGFMFVLQNQGTSVLGGYGQFLGFGGITKSAGIKFDLYNNAGEGENSTGLFTNGAWPTTPSVNLTPSGVDLHSGHLLQTHISYLNKVLAVTITDTVTNASATQTYSIDLPATLGASTAYVGFTAGTGGLQVNQYIKAWAYNAQ